MTRAAVLRRRDEQTRFYPLSRLPYELLAEIMKYLPSTRDLLSALRCSKELFYTMIHPSFSYVWKYVRIHCAYGPLPNPLPIYSEVAYAAFVFDGGICEICRRPTENMWTFFAIQLRLCNNRECRKSFLERAKHRASPFETEDASIEVNRWLLVSESKGIGTPEARYCVKKAVGMPSRKVRVKAIDRTWMCRQADWNHSIAEYERIVMQEGGIHAYRECCRLATERKQCIMEFYEALYDWKLHFLEVEKLVSKRNSKFTTRIARKQGWQRGDLINATDYHNLLRLKNLCLEPITKKDFKVVRPSTASALLRMEERRKNKEIELPNRERIICLEELYATLKSSQDAVKKPIPPLRTFLRLPAMRVIVSTAPLDNLVYELRNGPLSNTVDTELEKWREMASSALTIVLGSPGSQPSQPTWLDMAANSLAAVLGYPSSQPSQPTALHPLHRATARFVCKRCRDLSPDKDDAYLDFLCACNHQCKERKSKREWSASLFERDEKAIRIISQILRELQVKEEELISLSVFRGTPEFYIHCKSCPGAIIIPPSSAIRHCRRHDDMGFSIIPKEVAWEVLVRPLDKDVMRTATDHDPNARKMRELKQFGCRHCEQRLEVDSPSQHGLTTTFHGIISHLKAKHGIHAAWDEDLYFTGWHEL